MKKDKKNKMIYMIVMGVAIVFLVIILIAIFIGKKRLEDETSKDDTVYNIGVPGELTEYNYICEMERPSTIEEFKVYNIEKVKVEEGNVIDTQVLVKTEYMDKDYYEDYKNSVEDSENIIFDDEKMIVIQTATGIQNHTQTPDGNEMKETYEEYKNSLEEIGYKCREANN